MSEPIQAGAVVFDADSEPGLGWAARAGGEPFRIQGVEALASDTLWWVNADFPAMRRAGLAANVFYRPTNYLRLDMNALLVEWGMRDHDQWPVDAAGGAQIAAGILDRMVRLHCAHFGITPAAWRPPRRSFRLSMRETLIPPDQRVDQTLGDAAAEAYQAYTGCKNRPRMANQYYVNLVRPRLSHALEVLQTPVPASASYTRIDPPAPGTDIPTWLDEHRGPMLCRVTLTNMDDDVAQLINFGAGAADRAVASNRRAGYTSSSMRQWITGDELRVYATFATVTVHEVLFWPDWVRPIEAIRALRDFSAVLDDYDHLSYTLGLYAEQLWTGLASPLAAPGEDIGETTNVIGPFLRAADRMLCLDAAHRIQDQKVMVSGYGVGRVLVALGSDQIARETASIGAIAGVIPPMPCASSVEPPSVLRGGAVHEARIKLIAAGLANDYAAVDTEIVGAVSEALGAG